MVDIQNMDLWHYIDVLVYKKRIDEEKRKEEEQAAADALADAFF